MKQKIFYPVPRWLACRPVSEISQGAKLTWGKLRAHSGRDRKNPIYPSFANIGLCMGVSARTANGYVRELENHGLIKRMNQLGARNHYILQAHHWETEEESFLGSPPRKISSHPPRKKPSYLPRKKASHPYIGVSGKSITQNNQLEVQSKGDNPVVPSTPSLSPDSQTPTPVAGDPLPQDGRKLKLGKLERAIAFHQQVHDGATYDGSPLSQATAAHREDSLAAMRGERDKLLQERV